MTMAAGFNCYDGLIIAADRQITAEKHYTDQACKLSELRWANGIGIWGYSGSPETARHLGKELMQRFPEASATAIGEAQSRFDSALSALTIPKKEVFTVLFGFTAEGNEKQLFRSYDNKLFPVHDCEVIGSGDSPFSRCLRGMALRFGGSKMNVWQAAVLAIYFVQQGKNYDGQWVGGPTDVHIIDKNRRLRKMDATKVRMWESYLDKIDQQFSTMLSTLTHVDTLSAASTQAALDFTNQILLFGEQVRTLKAVEDAG